MKTSSENVKIVELTSENIPKLGLFCISNPKHPGYQAKLQWLKERFKEGLRIKMVVPSSGGKPCGFIEFVPGEHAWRAVEATDFMFIHCLWVYPRKNHNKGYGSLLISDCIEEAKRSKMNGVAVIASEGPWLPDSRIFEKNGFKRIETSARYELWAHSFKRAKLPKILDWQGNLKPQAGLTLSCAAQCPYTAISEASLKECAHEMGVSLKVVRLKTAESARNAGSGTGVFALSNKGKLHADHYISTTRFKTIVAKELA